MSLDPEPSGTAGGRLLPVFRQVLAEKPLIVDGYLTEPQIDLLLRELPHEGLYIAARTAPD